MCWRQEPHILRTGLAKPGDQRSSHSASAPCPASPEHRGKARRPRSARNCTRCRVTLHPLLFQSSRTPFARLRKPKPSNISWCSATSQVRMRFVGNPGGVCRAATESPEFCLERPRPCHEHQESRRATPTVGALPKRLMWRRHPKRSARAQSRQRPVRHPPADRCRNPLAFPTVGRSEVPRHGPMMLVEERAPFGLQIHFGRLPS